ncbi:unnamed protein product [Lathyrus sativus]|nr:unnamed protein product [Lathyrus sativus]
MLISDEGDNGVFFDALDCFSPSQESLLRNQYFGYDFWLNEPLSVKERKENFLQKMGFVDASSEFTSENKIVHWDERITDCSETVSNDCVLSSTARVVFESRDDDDKTDASLQGEELHELRNREAKIVEEFQVIDNGKKKKKNWWKHFVNSGKLAGGIVRSKFINANTNETCRINVRHNKKSWNESSAVHGGQEIRAHKGLIWTMKFSPRGQYLATGGEDGVVHIWHVSSLNASSICYAKQASAVSKLKHGVSFSSKKCCQSPVVVPSKILKIEESPLQELYGHSSDVVDLAWSDSDMLLSSSMDKTVRMWKIGYNQCLKVFHHKDYVTCIQFNPVDENYFISGSIDGKVRIWGIHEERVVDWADTRDVISAISYQPDGKGFVVGSLCGICRFYVTSGQQFVHKAKIRVNEKKKRSSGNKITGIQFSHKNHRRVMITSRDSKVRIFEDAELVQTYRGLLMSRSQMSGSFTSSGNHIISVGEDSRVYIWNFNDSGNYFSKQRKTDSSCEHFRSKGVTVAIPWSGMTSERSCSFGDFVNYSSEKQRKLVAAPSFRESERFSFGSWFSIDGSCHRSMTWPEEKLPSWGSPLSEIEFDHDELSFKDLWHENRVPETWGLSVVAAGLDGTIKTFHNFGFPVRL